MFLDEATITVHGGKGGDGIVDWRREKYIPRGGPAGGDGGDGGDIIFLADHEADTLSSFTGVKDFHAEDGENGGVDRCGGKNGKDRVLRVPPGTVITEAETGKLVVDLFEDGLSKVIAKGGRGGYGNAHFATSIRQAPDFAEKGETGKVRNLHLELKLVAEVGIIGYPSVGKSTLISVISAAKPKIADYPFTTLVPNLGVVTVYDRTFIVCDIPGLIEGASDGKGLGTEFLRHIERCGTLVHLLDVNREDLVQDYRIIRKELERYSPTLAKKRELVVLNKIDLVQNDPALFVEELRKNGINVTASIAAATHFGIKEFLNKLLPIVLVEKEKRLAQKKEQKEEVPTLSPHLTSDRTDAFKIEEETIGKQTLFRVRGKRIEQIAQMTDWGNNSAIQRFRDIEERIGLQKALKNLGANESSTIFIGETDVSGVW